MPLFDLSLAELERYLPEVAEPEDLDDFWSAALSDARTDEPLLEVSPVDTGLRTLDTWDVTFSGAFGHPIRAWYTRPSWGAGQQLPAVVEYLGYGRGRGFPHERLTWASAGYAHLLMDTRGQGSQGGSGGHTPDPVGSGPAAPGCVTRGIRDPAEYYYTRLITDAVRAVDTVRHLPDVDAARVAVVGNSQGGGLAVAVAGLVPDLVGALPSAPFLCHIQRALAITDAHPYAEIIQYLAAHRGAYDQVLRTLSYVDGMHLARRARAAALFSVGLRDTVCPPSTTFATYNVYGSLTPGASPRREISVFPFNQHEGGEAAHVDSQLRWLRARMAEADVSGAAPPPVENPSRTV